MDFEARLARRYSAASLAFDFVDWPFASRHKSQKRLNKLTTRLMFLADILAVLTVA
jgi:hypothetical protein